MRRLIVTLGVLAVCFGFAGAAMAKTGCVLTHDRHVICGTLVPPGYRPPAPVDRPRAVVKCKRGSALVHGACVVRKPRHVAVKCRPRLCPGTRCLRECGGPPRFAATRWCVTAGWCAGAATCSGAAFACVCGGKDVACGHAPLALTGFG